MADICPTVTAYDNHEYRAQMERIMPFASRIHVDLMDGQFAPTKSPDIEQIWLPKGIRCDVHLMYQEPMQYLEQLIKLKPHMVVIHNEAHVHHMHFAAELHKRDIKVGLALLHETPVHYAEQIMHSFDHILLFSGHLGYHGGQADLGMLHKVQQVRELYQHVEIGWDGGINAENARQLVAAGVDVLNVGGFIQHATNAGDAYSQLVSIAD